MIFEFTRSHGESRAKQDRLSRRWEHNRKNLREGTYHLSNLPGWLKLKDKKDRGYATIPERVAIVREIFQLSIDGLGLSSIAKHLNEKKVETFGKSDYWQKSTISKILHNRAVLGEYQPFTSVRFDDREYQTVKRVPTGDPIKGHFPAIVDESVFNRAALALSKRENTKSGPRPESTNNLFPGIVIDVRDNSKMHNVEKDGLRLVSSKSLAGATDDKRLPIPYQMFESAFVAFVDQMPLALVMPKKTKSFDTQIAKLQKEVDALQLQVEQIKEKTKKNHSDVLLELLVERDQELRAKKAEIEALERQKGSTASLAAKSSKAILEHLSKATGDELATLRLKLRNELRYWIKQIYVLPLDLGGVRAFIAEVELNNGKSFTFRASRQLIDWPTELDGQEIQKFNDWPKNIRKTSWDAETELDRKVRELDDAGHPIQYIATELGIKPSTVSKMLIRMGRRRTERRRVDSEQLMTWHPQGAGWQRIYKGKRYFVGMGTLQSLYPKLIKSRDKEGSMKAANRWWNENGGTK